jgi:hypothetical protein
MGTVRQSTGSGDDTAAEYERAHQWRDATRELVLVAATVTAAAHHPQSQGSISIAVTGKSLSNDLLLANTGDIALPSISDHANPGSFQMRVVPVRLDILSDLPAILVLGHDVTEPTQLRLVIELTANNPHTDTASVMECEYDSVHLDARTSFALLDFVPPRTQPRRVAQ